MYQSQTKEKGQNVHRHTLIRGCNSGSTLFCIIREWRILGIFRGCKKCAKLNCIANIKGNEPLRPSLPRGPGKA